MIKVARAVVVLILLGFVLVQCNIIWIPPKSYKITQTVDLNPPVMTLDEYTSSGLIDSHPRPFIFTKEIKPDHAALMVFGAEHSYDPQHKQFAAMKENWDKFKPTVAMVEGKLDLILKPIFNPVKASGEGGFVQTMAKKNGIKLYTWEPGMQEEINYALRKVDPLHVATFYCLRPYNNKWDQLSKDEQDKKLKSLISKRASYPGLKGSLTSVAQVDSLWKMDFPDLPSWRSYKHPRNGWPEGKFETIAYLTNSVRDDYMCNAILELVGKGERVFISMGSSHAVRIEKTLNEMLH